MSMNDRSVTEFAEALASRASVPGGGGASALCGALGAALGSMVGEFTVGKKKYAAVEDRVRALMVEAESLRLHLLECVDKDAAAFEPLSRAYALPKDDPARDAALEECLRAAAQPPLEMLQLCCEGVLLHRDLLGCASTLMLSDVGTGAVLCWGAMYGAAMNVKVNTALMRDRAYAAALNEQVDELVAEHWKIAEQVYEDVYRRYS